MKLYSKCVRLKKTVDTYDHRLVPDKPIAIDCYSCLVNEICPTVITAHSHSGMLRVFDGKRIRKFTPREFCRLQGFPESFEIVVSERQLVRQMGNSITVDVLESILNNLDL